jgi:hypothetical protein
MVGQARLEALQKDGIPLPSPQFVRALIDTGASLSAVDLPVLQALNLSQTGEADVHTPSTGGSAVKIPTFDVKIGILAGRPDDMHFISETIQVTGSDLSNFGFSVLIGRDILAKCILHYNGADELFTLSY